MRRCRVGGAPHSRDDTAQEGQVPRHGAKDIFNDGRLSAFYRDVAANFLSKGWLDLSYLKLDDTVLAAHFGFVYGHRFYYYMPSFRPEYAVYSRRGCSYTTRYRAPFKTA